MIPFVVLIIPLYQLMVGIGWVDSIPALIFPWIFTAYGTFLMRQFFVTLPKELEEAAFIDGASRWTVLWRIYVPLSLPALATLATFEFLYAWNSFVWPFIVISTGNDDAQVLTVALQPVRRSCRGLPTARVRGRDHRRPVPHRPVRPRAALLPGERGLQRHQVAGRRSVLGDRLRRRRWPGAYPSLLRGRCGAGG